MNEQWECPYCGDYKYYHSKDVEFADGELEASVTCQFVHIMRDDGYGVALTHEEFKELSRMFGVTKDKFN